MQITYQPYDPDWVKKIRNGGPDDYAMPAEQTVSDGGGNPCRYCLDEVPKGVAMLICAARPFPTLQPYAETGPIFYAQMIVRPFTAPECRRFWPVASNVC